MSDKPFCKEAFDALNEARLELDETIDFIVVFTQILSQYKTCTEDASLVAPYAIGYLNEILHEKATDLIELLDRFVGVCVVREAQLKEEQSTT